MKTRAITAFFFTIVMLCSIFLGSYAFTCFYLVLSILSLFEFFKLIKNSGIRPHRNIGLIASALIFLMTAGIHYLKYDVKYLLLCIPLVFSVFVTELYKKSKIPFANISYTFVGFVYVTIPFCFFHALGFLEDWNVYNLHFPFAFLLMLWGNDTGAYLFGMKFGKRKLFERHSPKKSWEGFFGGVLTSVLVAVVLAHFYTEQQEWVWIGMAILISCFGTIGDLVESMLKRSLDTKDSGGLLPGHGGLLDRFDGLLLAAPVVYAYLYLIFY
ncbi:phosphatidate cytidylyltransferase [Pedobacter sp. MW01-1-1]|uniref:phosphatidate cytidylyltransferase n=1 Tax=Pedobacter sp. MW01-1-1 TaxID=3383027 RepID=UPI003FF0DAE8